MRPAACATGSRVEVVGAKLVALTQRRGVGADARPHDRDELLARWRRRVLRPGGPGLGEAGVGKSRMAAAILGTANAQLRFLLSVSQGSTLHPCIQQLEWAAGFARGIRTRQAR
jgi:hypothetical protein